MAQGVPVVATAMGGLPELLGPGRCTPPGDRAAFAARVAGLWADGRSRQAEGEDLLDRARERHGEERYVRELLAHRPRWAPARPQTPLFLPRRRSPPGPSGQRQPAATAHRQW